MYRIKAEEEIRRKDAHQGALDGVPLRLVSLGEAVAHQHLVGEFSTFG
jgi:hypothetical protein